VVAQGRTVATGTVAALSLQAGHTDFEEAFVRLAFGAAADPAHPPAGGTAAALEGAAR
jgi:sodium transport system ATP-binding protein